MKILKIILVMSLFSFFGYADERKQYKELNMISDMNNLQARLERSFYNALYFEDFSKQKLIDIQVKEMVSKFSEYSNEHPTFNYCFYASQELLKMWEVKKNILNTELNKNTAKEMFKHQENISQFKMYCINNIISTL